MKYTGYIGTYTKGDSKGIYSFTLDTAAKKLGEVSVAAALDNPTYLNLSKDNRFVMPLLKKARQAASLLTQEIRKQAN